MPRGAFTITIKCSRPVYRRAGLRFGQGLNEFPAEEVSQKQLEIIEADPVLEIKVDQEALLAAEKKAKEEAAKKTAADKKAKAKATKDTAGKKPSTNPDTETAPAKDAK